MSYLVFAAIAEKPMENFWQIAPERLVVSLAALAVLVTIACYVIAKVRPKPAKKERRASQWLSKFRDSHSRGELSDEEFRTIKTTLASQLQDELTDTGEKKLGRMQGDGAASGPAEPPGLRQKRTAHFR